MAQNVTLFTTHCPKCEVLLSKLEDSGIDFTVVDDIDKVIEVGTKNGIMSAPILQVGDKVMPFDKAIEWVRG
jgi:glutaredoxin